MLRQESTFKSSRRVVDSNTPLHTPPLALLLREGCAAWPHHSTWQIISTSPRCIANHSFGCFLFEGVPALWIANGCRGVFSCGGGDGPAGGAIRQRCGRAGNNNERVNICLCERDL